MSGRLVILVAVALFLGGASCNQSSGPSPNCNDHKKDGSETDVDCGGPMCAVCNDGMGCNVARDCLSKLCSAGRCNRASCGDGIRNGSESDVDCGGPDCPACSGGQICFGDNDCTSMSCVGDGGTCL